MRKFNLKASHILKELSPNGTIVTVCTANGQTRRLNRSRIKVIVDKRRGYPRHAAVIELRRKNSFRPTTAVIVAPSRRIVADLL